MASRYRWAWVGYYTRMGFLWKLLIFSSSFAGGWTGEGTCGASSSWIGSKMGAITLCTLNLAVIN